MHIFDNKTVISMKKKNVKCEL